MSLFDTPLITALGRDLDGLWARYRVIQENMANYETPNYKAKTVSFEGQLQTILDRQQATDSQKVQALRQLQPQTFVKESETLRLDGNNVDVEKEGIEASRTQYNYQYSMRLLTDEFTRLRAVINEGRK